MNQCLNFRIILVRPLVTRFDRDQDITNARPVAGEIGLLPACDAIGLD